MTKIDSSLFQASSESIRHAFGDCPECGSSLHILNSKKGKFLGCTAYPECNYSQPLSKQSSVVQLKVIEGSRCPECASELAVKKGRYGMFIGCTNFPACHFISKQQGESDNFKPVKCPECTKGYLAKRSSKAGKLFYSCDQYPKCKYLVNEEPVDDACPECGTKILFRKQTDKGAVVFCHQKNCSFERDQTES